MNVFSKTILVLVSCLAVFAAGPALAAELLLEMGNREFAPGEEFLTSVFLNTAGESVNALEGTLFFPEELLEVKTVRDGNSIINFWIERPAIGQAGTIIFSGITPGGYQGAKGLLFSVIFQTKTSGQGAIGIRAAKVLRNDGEGTSVEVKISPFRFSISKGGDLTYPKIEAVKDTDPPEKFKPEIAQNAALFGGGWFLVFATQDKGSGINRYEVCEENEKTCAVAGSPYLLQNQALDKKILVKAIDKNGNERIEIFYPPNFHSWYKNYWILAILIIAAVIIGVILRRGLWQKFIKPR